jgi:hypothetical protein
LPEVTVAKKNTTRAKSMMRRENIEKVTVKEIVT